MTYRCAALGPGAAIPCAMTAGAARIAVGDRAPEARPDPTVARPWPDRGPTVARLPTVARPWPDSRPDPFPLVIRL
jgi:hypothetical protein